MRGALGPALSLFGFPSLNLLDFGHLLLITRHQAFFLLPDQVHALLTNLPRPEKVVLIFIFQRSDGLSWCLFRKGTRLILNMLLMIVIWSCAHAVQWLRISWVSSK